MNSPYNTGNDTSNYICQVIVSWAESKDINIPESNVERIALIKTITSDWAPHLRKLIEIIPDDAEATAIHLADWFPSTKREHERVVLMGDAAHTMTMCKWTITPSSKGFLRLIGIYLAQFVAKVGTTPLPMHMTL